jgi:hypothetical protein
MSSSRRRLASRLSKLALAASIVVCCSPAVEAQQFEHTGRLCASAAAMVTLAGALAPGGYLDKSSDAAVKLGVHRDGNNLRIQNRALGIDLSPALAFEPTPQACAIAPNAEKLDDTGLIPLAYVASFAQVERYRVAHPPADGADLTNGGTSTMMAAYGPYVLIMPWNKPDVPMVSLSCKGGEYYRVDPRTNAVLPFDGCVEGHNRVLPSLSQLPP